MLILITETIVITNTSSVISSCDTFSLIFGLRKVVRMSKSLDRFFQICFDRNRQLAESHLLNFHWYYQLLLVRNNSIGKRLFPLPFIVLA